jgi:hypothetical protein
MMVETRRNIWVKWAKIFLEVRGGTERHVKMQNFGTLASLYSDLLEIPYIKGHFI